MSAFTESERQTESERRTEPIWLLVGFHPATRSVQSTPADNTRKRVWQYIEKERKKERNVHDFDFIFYGFGGRHDRLF